jgi:hypothetical protein
MSDTKDLTTSSTLEYLLPPLQLGSDMPLAPPSWFMLVLYATLGAVSQAQAG